MIKSKIKISHNIIFHPNSPIEAGASGILKGEMKVKIR